MKQTNHIAILILCFLLFATENLPAESIAPQDGKADPDGTTVWYDCKLLTVDGKGWKNTEAYYDRLPAKARDTVRTAVWNLSRHTAGMCVRFTTDAASVKVRWTLLNRNLAMPHMPATGVSGVDLYAKSKSGRWYFLGNGRPTAVANNASFKLGHDKECILYLPLYNGVKSVEIGIPKNRNISETIEPDRKQQRPVVFYGTSITQGGCASRPGLACTAIVGRKLDVSIINLGFSGNGRMEIEMAGLLAELEPAAYVLDCLWNMSAEMVSERVEPFVKRLRQEHPKTPILLVEDSSVGNLTPTAKGQVLRDIYEELKAQGIANLYFLANRGMLGEDGEGTVDGCHPNDLGMMRQAAVFTKSLARILQISTAGADSLPVYFGTYTSRGENASKGIYRSELDLETGKLSRPVLAAEARNPSFLELHPGGKFLYAVSESGGAGSVSAYAIDADTGKLKFLNRQSSGGAGPCHVCIDHAGKNVLVANYGSGSASVIPIKADGELAEPTGFVQHTGSSVNPRRQKGPHAHSINVSPDNRFAYVADLGIDKIMIYRLDVEKGTIAANSPPFAKVNPGAGPRHFSFSPNGKFAYVINELDCTVTVFAFEPASGALKQIQTIATLPNDFDGSSTCAEVRVHPSGKFLYGSNRGHDSIVVYQIDPAEGTLTFVEHETADIKTPRNFNIDPTGEFCLVANQGGDSVVVFRIDRKTGALEPTGHKISVPKPVCVRFLKPPP
jgi:6-phosphogluconolactonase